MAGIAALRYGFLTGEARLDLATGRFDTTREAVEVSHLSAVFGLPEVCAELIDLDLGVPGFEEAWLDYCRLYLAGAERQAAEVGRALEGVSLIQAHSRLAAYAAARTGDAELARLAWRAFFRDEGDRLNVNPLQRERDWRLTEVRGPAVLMPVTEAPFISTNDAAQYGLAAIQNLALVPEHLPGAPPGDPRALPASTAPGAPGCGGPPAGRRRRPSRRGAAVGCGPGRPVPSAVFAISAA